MSDSTPPLESGEHPIFTDTDTIGAQIQELQDLRWRFAAIEKWRNDAVSDIEGWAVSVVGEPVSDEMRDRGYSRMMLRQLEHLMVASRKPEPGTVEPASKPLGGCGRAAQVAFERVVNSTRGQVSTMKQELCKLLEWDREVPDERALQDAIDAFSNKEYDLTGDCDIATLVARESTRWEVSNTHLAWVEENYASSVGGDKEEGEDEDPDEGVKFRLYTGPMPNIKEPATGKLLVEMNLDRGVLTNEGAKREYAGNVINTGEASYYRLVTEASIGIPGDVDTFNVVYLQGPASELNLEDKNLSSGMDFTLANLHFAKGEEVTVKSFIVRERPPCTCFNSLSFEATTSISNCKRCSDVDDEDGEPLREEYDFDDFLEGD
jgi:hypothetical protein